MLPPARGSGTDTSAPLSEWCPYSFHARAKECQLAIGNAFRSHVSSTNGFGYTGAQCVPLAEAVAPREAALTRAADVLERALGRRGRLVRQRTIAGLTVDLAVLAPAADDDSVLLALDVGEDSSDRVVNTRTRRLATAGVPEYWRIELHPSRDVLSIDSVRTWQQPDAASGQYFLVSGSSRNPDTSLKPVSFPGVAIPIDDLLAAPCGEARAKRAPHEDRPVGAALCSGLSFPLGGAPGPTIVFSDVGRDGVATRLLFTGVSTRPSTPFDPTVNGLAIQIGGPFFGETVLETLLPAGASWSRPDESSWTYRDPEGRSSGITEVAVHSAEAERLAWEIRGERGRYRASLDEMRQWGSLAVRLRAGTGSTEPCGSVFFRTAAEVGTCHGELPGTVRCVAPDRLYACSSRDPDARLRCTLQEVAHAEDVFFATHGRFFSGKCEDLLETALPPPLMCTVMGAGSVFTAVANDPRATMGCKWDSAPKAGAPPMTCS